MSAFGNGAAAPGSPGWWIASDGRWYPPESHPRFVPPPTSPTPPAFPTLPDLMQPARPRVGASPPIARPGQYPGTSGQYPGTSGQYPGTSGQYFGTTGQYPRPLVGGADRVPVRETRHASRQRRSVPGLRRLAVAVFMVVVLAATWVVAPRLSTWSPTLSSFAGVSPAGPANPIPAALTTPGTLGAVASTVIVDALGCGPTDGYIRGSGWPVSPQDIVTAAHVVAGSDGVAVQLPDRPLMLATVVSFAGADDLAVVYVPGAHFTPLAVGSDPGGPIAGLFIGYPGTSGSDETVVAGTVNGGYRVSDSYNFPAPGATHPTEEIDAAGIGPGFSGGPIVDSTGTVLGMMQAAEAGGGGVGLALPPSTIRRDAGSVVGVRSAVPTGTCAG